MTTVIRRNPVRFLKELKMFYNDIWEIPGSKYLSKPDFLVVDQRGKKRMKVSFVALDDGETVSVVYEELN